MISIKLQCEAPKRLKGDYPFNSFKELYLWIKKNFNKARLADSILIALAEHGKYSGGTAHEWLEVSSSPELGYKAKELAREIGLLRPGIGGDRHSTKVEKGLEFAEELDKICS